MNFNGSKESAIFGRITDLKIEPIEYYRLLGHFNLLIQDELSKELNKNSEEIGRVVTLITVGSDGRLEKGSFMSPLEVIAIVDESVDVDFYQEKLIKTISSLSPTRIANVIEMKDPQSSMITAHNNRYQPGRVADARLIYGDDEELKRSKIKLGEQINELNSEVVNKIASLRREARKVTEKGVNRIAGVDAMHFDLASGSVFFNPEAYQLSFKIGPLRLVQNSLLVEEVKHVRRENDTNFFSRLDPNIVSRLNQLSDDKMLSLNKESIQEICEHYAFFLRLYHRSERAYERSKQVVLKLEPTEIAEVAKRLKDLSVLMDKFSIKK